MPFYVISPTFAKEKKQIRICQSMNIKSLLIYFYSGNNREVKFMESNQFVKGSSFKRVSSMKHKFFVGVLSFKVI